MAIEYFHVHESDYDMLEQLVALEQEVHSSRGAGLNMFEVHSYIRYGRVYAAVDYDEVLGCAYFMRDFDNPNRVFLYGILVKPSESGKRLGESLLTNAFADLKESGLRMVEVTVHPSNYKALRVYREELDFHVINAADDSQAEEEDFLILRKTPSSCAKPCNHPSLKTKGLLLAGLAHGKIVIPKKCCWAGISLESQKPFFLSDYLLCTDTPCSCK